LDGFGVAGGTVGVPVGWDINIGTGWKGGRAKEEEKGADVRFVAVLDGGASIVFGVAVDEDTNSSEFLSTFDLSCRNDVI
jgi:hypothetical protein